MNTTRLGDDVETTPAVFVDDSACERALRRIRRLAGDDAETLAQALGLAPYVSKGKRGPIVREPREFLSAATQVATVGFNGRP